MSYFPKPSLNENDLAIIERGATAAHSIDAGQYVTWHGKTGKAKSAILQGATLSDSLFDYDEDGILNASIFPYLVYEGTLTSTSTEIPYPTGYNQDNTCIIALAALYQTEWSFRLSDELIWFVTNPTTMAIKCGTVMVNRRYRLVICKMQFANSTI